MSVRLDTETERLVERLAKARGRTKSEVVRAAIRSLAHQEKRSRDDSTLYDRIHHLIGIVDSGGANLSENTGEKFRQLLEARRRERRPR